MRYEKGQIMNANFFDYRIPYSVDTPEMDVTIIESNDEEGPYGAKEAGEGLFIQSYPSIGNAIFGRGGIRMTELPLTPEKSTGKIQEKN
jgi:4-hydroxybenzoyl-CoA reductase subunit alpha